MPLSNLIFRTIRWSAWDGPETGMEHTDVRPADGGLNIAGVVIGESDGSRFGLAYRIRLDATWHTREAHLRTTSGQTLHLESDGHGHWQANGVAQPDLQGCIDIDIQATPLTNTLPIRRLDFKQGERLDLRLCYIAVPELTFSVAEQCYTALDSSLYRFESLENGFTADLPVDEDGFVRDYPGLFRRMG
jgi:uncharacterized protein